MNIPRKFLSAFYILARHPNSHFDPIVAYHVLRTTPPLPLDSQLPGARPAWGAGIWGMGAGWAERWGGSLSQWDGDERQPIRARGLGRRQDQEEELGGAPRKVSTEVVPLMGLSLPVDSKAADKGAERGRPVSSSCIQCFLKNDSNCVTKTYILHLTSKTSHVNLKFPWTYSPPPSR